MAWFGDFVRGVGWREVTRFKFPGTEHINVKEMKARCADVKRRAASNVAPGAVRFLQGIDSLVTVGAAAKGRSSSWRLNSVMRRCTADILLGRLFPGEVYVPTELNPADCPTRGKSPPAERPAEAWPSWLPMYAPPPQSLDGFYAQLRRRRGKKRSLWRLQPKR